MEKNWMDTTWFGNMYQKFETLCLDVNDAIPQETLGYVEKQLQTAGTNVKRFCSNLVQDVLCSIDNERRDPSLSVINLDASRITCEELNISISEDQDHSKQEPLHSFSDETVEALSDESVTGAFSGLSSEHGYGAINFENTEECVEEDPINGNYYVPQVSDVVAPAEKDSGIAVLSQASDDVTGSSFSVETGDGIRSFETSFHTSNTMQSFAESCEGDAEVIQLTPSQNLTESIAGELNGCIVEKANVITELDPETVQSYDQVKLGGSCIVVDSAELSSVPNEARRCRAFKIRLPFASRKTLKKHNCDGHAVKMEDLDLRFNQRSSNGFIPSVTNLKSNSSDDEFSESDWELIQINNC